MPEFSCADYTFPLLSRTQSLQLIRLLEFDFVDIGLFERSPNYPPSALMSMPSTFISRVQQDLKSAGIRPSDLFLQIGLESGESPANDPDPTVRMRNREVFRHALDLCAAIECGHMTGLPGVHHVHAEMDFALATEEAAWRLELSRQAGIVYSIEPHIGSICADTASTRRFLSNVEGLTLTLDYGHFISLGEESGAVHSLLSFATHVHLRGGAPGRLQASVAENTIDFEGMMAASHSRQYMGKFALEYVWVDWQGCNRVDNLSETILLRRRVREIAAELNWKVG